MAEDTMLEDSGGEDSGGVEVVVEGVREFEAEGGAGGEGDVEIVG